MEQQARKATDSRLHDKFQKGSGGKYVWDDEASSFVKISDQVRDPNAGFNGPVWFPKGGHKYFDRALNREFSSLSEKKQWMKENKIIQQAPDKTGDLNCPEAGLGKRYYFIPGVKSPKYYKRR